MEIYALVGRRGTGKATTPSFWPTDAGLIIFSTTSLLIKGNQILAGRSAKRSLPLWSHQARPPA